ncbi:MAG: DUF2075 domain-containing protein [Chloroflexia bacterium]|nr:DUF2075 domain-containing protein [Chloroflexia bacterium]
MQLYAGSSVQFIEDAVQNRIAEKLRQAFFNHFLYQPAQSEIRSWQNSLRAVCNVLQYANLTDHGIILELQLPLSSKRLDCMVTGKDAASHANAVVVELKQWQEAADSHVDDCVTTFVAGRLRDVLHPSRQVGQYQEYLGDYLTAFSEGNVALSSCSYLHNVQYDPTDVLFAPKYSNLLASYPLFTGDQTTNLATYLHSRLQSGAGLEVMSTVLESKYRASKKLLDHTSAMIRGQREYVLLDEQLVVFNSVLAEARSGFHAKQKAVILVHGGPGTGKSVVALNLVGELSRQGYNTLHATGSKAFTENMRRIVGSRAATQFKYFNSFTAARRDEIDVLVMDEAHRIRESSSNRFTRRDQRTDTPQVDELIAAAKVAVFFIDDLQVVRPGEVGSLSLIRSAASRAGARLVEYELEAQFRCNGSDGFINWVDNTLGIRRTPNILWDGDDAFDFRIVASVQELEQFTRQRQDEGSTARLTAGFCWPWSNPTLTGELVPDVEVGDWRMPWNAKSRGGRLAAGIPKEDFWASDPRGIEQVGCIYTAQGFEYDYAGVIFGRDLCYDPEAGTWNGDPRVSHDTVVKRSPGRFVDLVKNTYRVLFTRGMKGCYVYFEDENTRNFFRSRIG